MATNFTRKQLLDQILAAVDEGAWQALVLDADKPFRLRLFKGDDRNFDVRIYIWNCTHGGGSARAADEYRVQITGGNPHSLNGETTLLLGWHPGYEVFVGFDIHKHDGQNSQSPSIQVKEETLMWARTHAFSLHHRKNDEIAVAFRPEYLVEYALNVASLHKAGEAQVDLDLLNTLDTLTNAQIVTVQNHERQTIITRISRRFRASDFRRRVLGAYSRRCAVCDIQLELVDAAHIIPAAASTSTDETKNGIALCKLHHAAFDRNLISFDQNYRVEISDSEIARLEAANLSGGLKQFKRNLRHVIVLPNDQRDYPPREYIEEARRLRNWA